MKKRLVIFHPAIAPYRVDFFNALAERFDAVFYFEFLDALEQSFDQGKLKSRLTFRPNYLRKGFGGIKNLRLDVWRILRREKPDLVLISEYNLLGLLVGLYKLVCQRRLRVVTVCDDNLDMARGASFVKRLTRGVMARYLSAVVLVDGKVKAWYEANVPGPRYLFFPILQDEEAFRGRLRAALPEARSLAAHEGWVGKRVVLYVGRLAKVKNLPLLLAAFRAVHEAFPDARLSLVGDGDERGELERLTSEYGLEEVTRFAGKLEGEALMARYALGDLFVLPSVYEPFGTVVNEALMAGCLVCCSSVAGASCLIDSSNGVLFDPNDERELAEAMTRTLERLPAGNRLDALKPSRMIYSYRDLMEKLLEDLERE